MANVSTGNEITYKLNKAEDGEGLKSNDRLRPREAEAIEEEVYRVAEENLAGVEDLRSQNLTRGVDVGSKTLEYDASNEFDEAKEDMEFTQRGDNQQVDYDSVTFANPIVHQEVKIGMRDLESSRERGQSLDVTSANLATRAVSYKLEDILFNGSNVKVNGDQNPGYLNFADRYTQSLGTNWTDSSATPVEDTRDAVTTLFENNFRGPYAMYLPNSYKSPLMEDYKAESERTLQQRLMDIEGIEMIRHSFKMPDNEILLVNMNRETVHLASGQGITVTDISPDHEIADLKLYVWANLTPVIRSDYNNDAGIVHIS